MRIIIAGPPKTGNIWIKCLLSEVYDLEILYRPPRTDEEFAKAVEDGWFPDGTIFHQHFAPTPLFLKTTEALGCALVTIIRNPYDTFVSLYHFVQNFPRQFARPRNPLHRIYGKPIDHPDVVAYLGDKHGGFGAHIIAAKKWMDSGKSILIRYEDLKADTARTLAEVTARIEPVSEDKQATAIETCRVENMRKLFTRYNKHIRKGKVGDWRNYLNNDHLTAINTHSEWIKALGYDVLV